MNDRRIAFLDLVVGSTQADRDPRGFDYGAVRSMFSGTLILNNLYDRASAIDAVQSGKADAIAFGRDLLANPDLVRRLRGKQPLNKPNPHTFYTPGPVGLTDYPFLPN